MRANEVTNETMMIDRKDEIVGEGGGRRRKRDMVEERRN